jgi:hypothetical protein
MTSNAQTSFLGGEWSKFAQGQTDDKEYPTAMNVCRNGHPIEEGCWVRRSGSRHMDVSRRGFPARLIPFNFDQRAPYNFELACDPLDDTGGQFLIFSGKDRILDPQDFGLVSISTASPAVVTVAAPVSAAWASGVRVRFVFFDEASKLLNPALTNRTFKIGTLLTSTTFTLIDQVTDAPIDGAALNYQAANITVALVISFPAPNYSLARMPQVRMVQSDKAGLFLHNQVAPNALTVLTPPTDAAAATFSIDPANFIDGPYLDPVSGAVGTTDAETGIVNLTLSFLAYAATRAYQKGDYVLSGTISYASLTDANLNNTPATSPTQWRVASPGEVIGPNGFQTTDTGRLIRLQAGDPLLWTWGKILGPSTTGAISGTLAGSTSIGDLINGGGLDAGFDGDTNKTLAEGPAQTQNKDRTIFQGYIGKNYSGATDQRISSVILFPSSDSGFVKINGPSSGNVVPITFNLRGKASAPGSGSDGTLLGTVTIPDHTKVTTPVTIVSTNSATAWKYVWVEMITGYNHNVNSGSMGLAALQFFSNSGVSGSGVKVQILGPALTSTSVALIRIGVYSDTTGWPTCGCWHEGRFWLAGSVGNRFDTTKSNAPGFVFSPTNPDGSVSADNGISYVFNSSEVNTIFWMQPDLQGIVAGTQGGEWLIQSGTANTAMAPNNIQAHRVTKYGCANIEPRRTGLTVVFVQKFKRRLLEYLADAFSGKFFGPNLSEKAMHLTAQSVQEIGYQEELSPIIWSRMGDGSFAGTTYRRISMFSSERPKMLGWHRHDLGSGRKVEALCVGPTVDGLLDALALTTNDERGVRHHEMIEKTFEVNDALTDAWFLDDAIVPSCGKTDTVAGKTGLRFYGLSHLEGKEVDLFIAGLDCGKATVKDASVFVPYGADVDGLFTNAYLQNVTTTATQEFKDYGSKTCYIDAGMLMIPAVIGFSFVSQGQLLRPAKREDAGNAVGDPFGKKRRLHQYAILFHNAQGVSVGTDFVRLKPSLFVNAGLKLLKKNELYSGIHYDTLADEYSFDGMLAWQIDRPYPAAVVSAGIFLSTQDK